MEHRPRRAGLRLRVAQLVDRLLDVFEGQTEIDLSADFQARQPATLICDLFGVPDEDREEFWLWFLGLGGPGSKPEEIGEASEKIIDYANALDLSRLPAELHELLSSDDVTGAGTMARIADADRTSRRGATSAGVSSHGQHRQRGQHDFGERLRNHRVRLGATQRQLADLSTVSVRAIRDLELGKATRPRRDTIRLIADGLGLTGADRAAFEAAARRAGGAVPVFEWESVAPPPPLDTLVCRDAEVAVLADLLGCGQRLVTLAGLPGSGKSRIALEVAGMVRMAGSLPVLWSAANENPAAGSLPELIRTALGGPFSGPASAAETARAELSSLLGAKRALLVVDGYERDRLEPSALPALLRDCSGLRTLVTARSPLGLTGERVFPLGGLPVPRPAACVDPAELAAVPAVQLFLRHVRQVQPGFVLTTANAQAVAVLCRRFDGLPVALEAAAACLMVYPPEVLLDDIEDDPWDLAGAELTAYLRAEVGSLGPAEYSLLGCLASVDKGWAMTDAVRMSGIPAGACAGLVRRLLIAGLVRCADESDRTRFAVLDLVKVLYRTSRARLRVETAV